MRMRCSHSLNTTADYESKSVFYLTQQKLASRDQSTTRLLRENLQLFHWLYDVMKKLIEVHGSPRDHGEAGKDGVFNSTH